MALSFVKRVSGGVQRTAKISFLRQSFLQTRLYSNHPVHLSSTPAPRVTTLPNGLRVATGTGFGDVATVGLWIDAGTIHENEKHNGVARFLANLALKGTSKYPQLAKEVEGIGATLNAHTTREHTSFVAESLKDDVPKIVEILASVVGNTEFSDENVESIRKTTKREYSLLKSNYEQVLLDHTHAAAFQGTPYAMTTLGEGSTTKNLKKEDIVKFAKDFYTSGNIVVVGTGAVQHDQLVELTKTHFANIPTGRNPRDPLSFVDYIGSEIRIHDDTTHLVRAIFSYEGLGRSHPHYWTLKLLKILIGNFSHSELEGQFKSSRIVETIAIEKLASHLHSFYLPYNNTGLFGTYVETTEDKIDDLTYEVYNEYQKLATYLSVQEVQRAKNTLKTKLLAHLEDPTSLAASIGTNILSVSRALSIPEIIHRVDAIQIKDIEDLVSTYFTDVDPVVVAYGPVGELPDYGIIRNWTYWNRW